MNARHRRGFTLLELLLALTLVVSLAAVLATPPDTPRPAAFHGLLLLFEGFKVVQSNRQTMLYISSGFAKSRAEILIAVGIDPGIVFRPGR